MVLIADYEGFVVEVLKLFWLAVTIAAFLLALGGIATAIWHKPRRVLACSLGVIACVVELIATVVVWLAFWDEYTHLGAKVERFRPGLLFWFGSLLTTGVGLLAIYLSLSPQPLNADK